MCTLLAESALCLVLISHRVSSSLLHVQGGEYGCWVGSGSFTEIFSSQARADCLCLAALHYHTM